jgi:hypothetical protein
MSMWIWWRLERLCDMLGHPFACGLLNNRLAVWLSREND